MDKLDAIISETLRLDPAKIAPTTAIHEVSTWNSLTHIELIISIEEAFGIQLTEDEIAAMRNVGIIKEVLAKRGVLVDK